jgi:hypothetical protein
VLRSQLESEPTADEGRRAEKASLAALRHPLQVRPLVSRRFDKRGAILAEEVAIAAAALYGRRAAF